jgi:hypothetical protein
MIKNIALTKRDLRKGLILPKFPSREFAYYCGVLAGDGSINQRKSHGDYEIKIAGNPKNEKKFYEKVICTLTKKLFNISVKPQHFDSDTIYGIRIWSKTLVDFFKSVGLPVGRKKNKLKVPEILYGKYEKDFIRGLFDTDFCLRFRRGNYPVISGSSNSEKFMKEISSILKNRGFKVTEYFNLKQKDTRFKKGYSVIHRIELPGHNNFNKWVTEIGSSHPKNIAKIAAFKR